jgi:hypothetical protein
MVGGINDLDGRLVEAVSSWFASRHQYMTSEKATERQDHVRAEQDVRMARKDPFADVTVFIATSWSGVGVVGRSACII